ncbi:hypothetical protein TUZN_1442 [Thermoproteus uzoniensis 768-20]|uniref:Uncharacterized protein n=1 Tax=Thermoproteus uzoniensis (strain 768-20) TaxID=999630 RepID=F2L1Q9_THEU7|nr:hypothetical protein [Thermoproteus uzoniensis]AEA12915.1 hypothetical protein TUZN_1442 [Thermoproteus uzoniensis 768-20]
MAIKTLYGVYSVAATAIFAIVLAAFVAIYSVYYLYDKALRAYLPVKIALDAWQELTSQLPNATICLVESDAVKAVSASDPAIYLSASATFNATLRELSRYPPLRSLRGGAHFAGEAFDYVVHYLNRTVEGRIDWVKPITLLRVAEAVSTASIQGGLDDVGQELAAYVPPGFSLEGYLEGVLHQQGDRFVGTLSGSLTLTERQRMRCLGYYLNKTFVPHIYASLSIDDNSTAIYIYIPVDIVK